MSTLYLKGASQHNDELELLLTDQLLAMGTGITAEPGSLAWCEAFALAKGFTAALNFIELMGNQLTATSMSVFADRFAQIYGIATQGTGLIPTNLPQIQTYVGLKQAVFGTPPNLAAVEQFIKVVLGLVYIDLEYVDQHVQALATAAPLNPGDVWFSPLSTLLVRVWQPRDNQDNLLMDTPTFLNTADSYKGFVIPWMPADIAVRNMHLVYPGADGYGSYASGLNVITGTAGTNVITGNFTTFVEDLFNVTLGYQMPIEVVDDNNVLQTYHVASLVSDTQLNTVETLQNNITSRRYRLLGIQMDVPYALDNLCFNQ